MPDPVQLRKQALKCRALAIEADDRTAANLPMLADEYEAEARQMASLSRVLMSHRDDSKGVDPRHLVAAAPKFERMVPDMLSREGGRGVVIGRFELRETFDMAGERIHEIEAVIRHGPLPRSQRERYQRSPSRRRAESELAMPFL